VIPVKQKPKPVDFDMKVGRKGSAWLMGQGFDLNKPLPTKTKPPAFWTECLPDLRAAYDNICAYVCIHIEEITGNATVKHFKPKSLYPKQIYDWKNYLLVCGIVNSRKRNFEDVLNPFSLAPETFYLNLTTGEIFVNPQLSAFDTKVA
jgi:uncharacterized protein (TIGR02646 family)